MPKRVGGNRTYGLTSVMDLGVPRRELENILEDYSDFIDIAKFGIGSAYITPNIKEKIKLYKDYNVIPYFGGTLFEKSYYQGKLQQLIHTLKELNIEWIEVSTGTIDIPIEERLNLISVLNDEFQVIAEVGSKDTTKRVCKKEWMKEINLLLEYGCEYVITEGRDSGTAGIYNRDGTINSDLIERLLQDIDVKKLIFEAPTPKHQMYFINKVGPNVNLGNVKLHDVLTLETQRHGLRCETFFMDEQACKLRV